MITYDYPLNEKIRTLLRLEDLYEKVRYFCGKQDRRDHHTALVTLFEILDAATRTDLKSELLQEMERQKQALEILRNHPNVDLQRLDLVLRDIERTSASLLAGTGKFGQHLRENEWLMGIKQRASIPGGACEFDLPSYHYWLNQDVEVRQKDLGVWFQPIAAVSDGARIVLKLLRESAKQRSAIAYQGIYQQVPAGRVAQMIRITMASEFHCVPEISANKYALNIRFISVGTGSRPHLYEQDVEFQVSFCNL
ncbi:MAG: cell division protein ZapD [Burkholderiales bacterium]|nr:cell division protein ZapD [Pseudomonadota bacterium]